MYKYLDYHDIPAVLIMDDSVYVAAWKLVGSEWKEMPLGDALFKGYVYTEADWRESFNKELKDAPPIPSPVNGLNTKP